MSPLIYLALVGFASGILFGLFLPTDWERKVRGLAQPWLPFGRGSILAILAGMLLIKIPLVIAVFYGLPLLMVWAFDLLPVLHSGVGQVFLFIYMMGIVTSKSLRYAYWRWTYRGQLL